METNKKKDKVLNQNSVKEKRDENVLGRIEETLEDHLVESEIVHYWSKEKVIPDSEVAEWIKTLSQRTKNWIIEHPDIVSWVVTFLLAGLSNPFPANAQEKLRSSLKEKTKDSETWITTKVLDSTEIYDQMMKGLGNQAPKVYPVFQAPVIEASPKVPRVVILKKKKPILEKVLEVGVESVIHQPKFRQWLMSKGLTLRGGFLTDWVTIFGVLNYLKNLSQDYYKSKHGGEKKSPQQALAEAFQHWSTREQNKSIWRPFPRILALVGLFGSVAKRIDPKIFSSVVGYLWEYFRKNPPELPIGPMEPIPVPKPSFFQNLVNWKKPHFWVALATLGTTAALLTRANQNGKLREISSNLLDAYQGLTNKATDYLIDAVRTRDEARAKEREFHQNELQKYQKQADLLVSKERLKAEGYKQKLDGLKEELSLKTQAVSYFEKSNDECVDELIKKTQEKLSCEGSFQNLLDYGHENCQQFSPDPSDSSDLKNKAKKQKLLAYGENDKPIPPKIVNETEIKKKFSPPQKIMDKISSLEKKGVLTEEEEQARSRLQQELDIAVAQSNYEKKYPHTKKLLEKAVKHIQSLLPWNRKGKE